ncbi:hypothetical protein LCER1_G005107 [Lachnellula cervina]|uniref:Uncharacterized protein n=1 Tax=Lachnellula cervina TaxID=1316786 RepID=A0A7D8Z066_9HELO|nr:hypothetical protein LCER1_G005107 [Lachnellula cervina]
MLPTSIAPAKGGSGSHHGRVTNERTALLPANLEGSSHGRFSREDTLIDEDTDEDIEANEFDNLLSRSESITTGLGIEPESQATAMLRGPRRYGAGKSKHRTTSHASSQRKSFTSTNSSIPEEVIEEGEEDKSASESPFLAGCFMAIDSVSSDFNQLSAPVRTAFRYDWTETALCVHHDCFFDLYRLFVVWGLEV